MLSAARTIPDQILEWSRLRPHELAMTAGSDAAITALSWAELHRQIESLATGLSGLGAQRSKVLALISPLELDAALLALAALRLGLTVLWLDSADPAALNNYLIRQASANYLFVNAPSDLEALRQLSSDNLPDFEVLLCSRTHRASGLDSLAEVQRAATARSSPTGPHLARPRPDDLAFLIPSELLSKDQPLEPWQHQHLTLAGRLASSCLGHRAGAKVTSLASPGLPNGILAGLFSPMLSGATLQFPEAAADGLSRILRSAPRHLLIDQELALALARRAQTLWQESSRSLGAQQGQDLWQSAAQAFSSLRASLRSDSQPSRALRFGLGIVKAIIHAPLRAAIGLEACESLAILGTSAAPRDLSAQLAALGLPLYELVGPATLAGVLAWREAGTDPASPLRFVPGLRAEPGEPGLRIDCRNIFPNTKPRAIQLDFDPRQGPEPQAQSPDPTLLSRARRAFSAHPLVHRCQIDADGPFDLDLVLELRADLLSELRSRLGLTPSDPRLQLCLRAELAAHVRDVSEALPKPTTLRRWTWAEAKDNDALRLRLTEAASKSSDRHGTSVKTESEERCSKTG